jgi:hypothetical protein
MPSLRLRKMSRRWSSWILESFEVMRMGFLANSLMYTRTDKCSR